MTINKTTRMVIGGLAALVAVGLGLYVYGVIRSHKYDVDVKGLSANEVIKKQYQNVLMLAEQKKCDDGKIQVARTNKDLNGYAVNLNYQIALGDCYSAANKRAEAKQYYQSAIDLAQQNHDDKSVVLIKFKLDPSKSQDTQDSQEKSDGSTL